MPAALAASSYSFTNATATGRFGPTQAQVTSAYTGTTLAGSVTVSPQGIQAWTVPTSGKYSISIAGAGGGGDTAGKGAVLYGEFTFTQGTILKVLVGQLGTSTSNFAGGGGGGSFVWNSASTTEPLIAAGGGGGDGGGATFAGVNASTSTSGTAGTWGAAGTVNTPSGAPGAGGTAGSAGETFDAIGNTWDAAAGAGWKGNSAVATQYAGGNANNAFSPLNGGTGGAPFNTNGSSEGGFGGGGGGGGSANSISSVGGGGGGYSGGGNGSNDSSTDRGAGGGGGSYNSGTNITATIASSLAHGYVTITLLTPPIATMSIAGNVNAVYKGSGIMLTLTTEQAGTVTFFADGKRIAGCIGQPTSVGIKTCNWKPASLRTYRVYATVSQNGLVVLTSSQVTITSTRRTGTR